jgi:hypothetical protein
VGFLLEMNAGESQHQLTGLVRAYDRFSQQLKAH